MALEPSLDLALALDKSAPGSRSGMKGCVRVRMQLGLAAMVLMGASEAIAAPLPRLVVVRSAEASDCPDAESLASAVERQMQRPALDPKSEDPSGAVYEVRIVRTREGYAATLLAGDQTRDLSDPGSNCAELAEALALTLAIVLDSDPAAPPAAQPEAPAQATPPPSAPRPSPRPAPKAPASAPLASSSSARRLHADVSLGLGETVGFLSPVSFALLGDAWLRYGRASFGAGVFFLPSNTITNADAGHVDLQLLTGSAFLCGLVWKSSASIRFSLCGSSLLGAVWGEGSGRPQNRRAAAPWVALGSMGLLEGHLAWRLGFSLRLGAFVPLLRQRFTATRLEGVGAEAQGKTVTLFEPPPIAGFLVAALHWSIL